MQDRQRFARETERLNAQGRYRPQSVETRSQPIARRRVSADGFSPSVKPMKFGMSPGLPPVAVTPTKPAAQPVQMSQLSDTPRFSPRSSRQMTSLPRQHAPRPVLHNATPVHAHSQAVEHREPRKPISQRVPQFGKISAKLSAALSSFKAYSLPQQAMLGAACMIFLFGLTVSIAGLRTNNEVQAQAENLSQQAAVVQESGAPLDENAGDVPAETDPGPPANYNVPPDQPKRISIPKLGVNARIKALGVKSNNELMAPANIYDAGWFQHGGKPGQDGAQLILGHVHGLTSPGVFYNLKKLNEGDIIEVERGDGQMFKYKVVAKQQYDRHNTDMQAAIKPVVPGQQGLNLMTCAGKVDKANNTYTERLLVQTVLIN